MNEKNEMLEEYDFSKGIRGKYAKRYEEGINIVKLDSDVTKFFSDTKSVNEALRTLIKLMGNEPTNLGFSS
jgi:hypothetical protein